MLHPSYNELIEKVNKNANTDNDSEPVVQSRYSIVIAAAKRARQLIDGDEPLIEDAPIDRPLSVAVDELFQGKVHVIGEDEEEETEEVPAEVPAETPASEE